jgi:hypothetical protein
MQPRPVIRWTGLVGSGGLAPPTSRVSDECSNWGELRASGCGRGQLASASRICASSADGGGHAPQPLRAHPDSSRGLRLGSFTIHRRRTENSNLSGHPPSRLPTGADALAGSSSMAESGRHDLHAVRRALVSSEAQHPGWFTLPGAPGGGRTLTPARAHASEACASAYSATGAWSGRRDLNSPYDHGKVACCR